MSDAPPPASIFNSHFHMRKNNFPGNSKKECVPGIVKLRKQVNVNNTEKIDTSSSTESIHKVCTKLEQENKDQVNFKLKEDKYANYKDIQFSNNEIQELWYEIAKNIPKCIGKCEHNGGPNHDQIVQSYFTRCLQITHFDHHLDDSMISDCTNYSSVCVIRRNANNIMSELVNESIDVYAMVARHTFPDIVDHALGHYCYQGKFNSGNNNPIKHGGMLQLKKGNESNMGK